MVLELIKDWFLNLGTQYGVNPFIFGGIYIGAIPFFMLSVAWTIRNLKKKKSIIFPIFSTGFFFISAYLYLIIYGRNVPLWVYAIIIMLIVLGIFTTVKKIRKQIHK